MPLTPYSGTLGKKAAAHLLRRATFGPNKQDIDTFSGYTAATAVSQLFQTVAVPLDPVSGGPNSNSGNVPAAGSAWIHAAPIVGEDDNPLQAYIIQWWLGQILASGVSPAQRLSHLTREKLTFFLHSHFTTIQQTVNSSRALYFQNVLLRQYAFDGGANPILNIRDLTKKISIDNAMLLLLDGRLNVKDNPNENYARELIELFTMGKGLSGEIPPTSTPGDYFYFTEQDVKAAAKVLSGFDFDNTFAVIDADTGLPRGKVKIGTSSSLPNQHDPDVKTFSSRWGNATITPIATVPTEASMLDEIDQLINLIYAQPETAKNICRKIYRFYVYYNITNTIDTTIIASMVSTLTANNFKIQPVIEELLQSQHFFDSATATVDDDNFGAIIKSPLDIVAGTLNFFEYQIPDHSTQPVLFYEKAQALQYKMLTQGMDFMNPNDVAGYDAYFQYPLFNRNWINTNALTQRYNFIYLTMTTDNMDADATTIDLLAYFQLRFPANATDPDALIREVISYLLPMYNEGTEISTARLDWFKSQFLKLGGVVPSTQLSFWIFSWNNASTIPHSATDARGMLQDLINATLQTPEYQMF